MTIKKVVECDFCKEQKIIDEFGHHVRHDDWFCLVPPNQGEQPTHFCSHECLRNHVLEEERK